MESASWRRFREERDGDGDIPKGVPREERDGGLLSDEVDMESGDRSRTQYKFVDVREKVPMDFYITFEDALRFKQSTRNCPGCS